jgi:hypothetical protein
MSSVDWSSLISPSTRWAKMPRLAASLTKSGSLTSSSRITGQAASWTLDQLERLGRAFAQADQRDVGVLAPG